MLIPFLKRNNFFSISLLFAVDIIIMKIPLLFMGKWCYNELLFDTNTRIEIKSFLNIVIDKHMV